MSEHHPLSLELWALLQRPSPPVSETEVDYVLRQVAIETKNGHAQPNGDERGVLVQKMWGLFQRPHPPVDLVEINDLVKYYISVWKHRVAQAEAEANGPLDPEAGQRVYYGSPVYVHPSQQTFPHAPSQNSTPTAGSYKLPPACCGAAMTQTGSTHDPVVGTVSRDYQCNVCGGVRTIHNTSQAAAKSGQQAPAGGSALQHKTPWLFPNTPSGGRPHCCGQRMEWKGSSFKGQNAAGVVDHWLIDFQCSRCNHYYVTPCIRTDGKPQDDAAPYFTTLDLGYHQMSLKKNMYMAPRCPGRPKAPEYFALFQNPRSGWLEYVTFSSCARDAVGTVKVYDHTDDEGKSRLGSKERRGGVT